MAHARQKPYPKPGGRHFCEAVAFPAAQASREALGRVNINWDDCYHMGLGITEVQYERIASRLPVRRGNVSMSNLRVLNAALYVAEHGCKWRGLPERFGNWHTVYTRMSRWSRNGVLAECKRSM